MPIYNRSIPSINSLIIFEASARLGTFSSAANELCITPTAVSKQIKNLESFLNTNLFLRKKVGLELTEKGQNYLITVTQVLRSLSESSQNMNDDRDPVDLTLEIGVCFSHFWLIPRLDDFRDKHPDINLNIITYTEHCRSIQSDLYPEHDVSFYYGALSDTADANRVLLFKERILLVCSPEFLTKHPDAKDMAKLWQQPLLGLRSSPDFWGDWESWAKCFSTPYQTPKNEMQMEDQIAVLHAAMSGAGIALAWDWHVNDLLKNGQLVALTKPVEFGNNGYFLTCSNSAPEESTDCFFHWVVENSRSYSSDT